MTWGKVILALHYLHFSFILAINDIFVGLIKHFDLIL